ncbi:acetyl-CoA synthase/corrinoid iron-sulfur protein/putative mercury methyltransferase HgcA [Desulfuromonas soudanensis]|uniref:Acetyl-CoA synthase/corrinoid iron-sulfur protein/putative mercury methyltransferase HgcA n=1 Tax=Desulfuromonas soudanensis TaxID=1603606 RepID=A0A0M4D2J5_9BACT|nr:acetyl-CoA synthase/corrinoid iron-sulfur protein/putative mercury methyltransferase HgcA [Desulfuromonas soudanensis]
MPAAPDVEAATGEGAEVSFPPPPSPTNRGEHPGVQLWSFVTGWIETGAGPVPQVATRLEKRDIFGRWQMRWGLGRTRYRITPGLYAVGRPDSDAPVLVTANYKLTFDTLRRELQGQNLWILVLETYGINVWCAAGKGTFGTEEVVRRIRAARLEQVVRHRTLILPQLGAPGVAAHEVQRESGFRVLYGPVRASDLKAFLAADGVATAQMRRVTFTTLERLVLTPVELTGMLKTALWVSAILLVLGGIGPGVFTLGGVFTRGVAAVLALFAALLTGAVLTPVALPWIPGRAFALKGGIAGAAVATVVLLALPGKISLLEGGALLLGLSAAASYCAMNFTGSSTFTSPSGVEKEMRRAIPLQGTALLLAAIFWIAAAF